MICCNLGRPVFSMEFLLLVLMPAAAIWAGIALIRSNAYSLAAIFLVSTCVFTAEFYAFQTAGVTWTLDRLAFLFLLAGFVSGWVRGHHRLGSWQLVDYLVGAFFVWLAVRTLTQPLGSIAPHQPHTLMHMINGYCIPCVLYLVLRTSKPELRQMRPAFWILAVFGIYLSITAFLEVGKAWTLVFPKFISDPELGIHFGRARGPMLQSVRLGICLITCWTAVIVFSIWLHPKSKAAWLAAIVSLPVFWGGVFLTYTRSIWMGLVFVVALLVILCLRGALRRSLLIGGALSGTLLLCVAGSSLIAFKREYSAAETRESTYMRAAFVYVSLQMFQDRPVAGFGFNQFNAANRPYLADRSTNIRLESIRGYVHHNSFLSLLVDLGIVGLGLYSMMFVGFVRHAWQLWRDWRCDAWRRGIALVALCLAGVHLIQMAFHEVSFSTIENSILFGFFGLVMAASKQQDSCQASTEDRTRGNLALPFACPAPRQGSH